MEHVQTGDSDEEKNHQKAPPGDSQKLLAATGTVEALAEEESAEMPEPRTSSDNVLLAEQSNDDLVQNGEEP